MKYIAVSYSQEKNSRASVAFYTTTSSNYLCQLATNERINHIEASYFKRKNIRAFVASFVITITFAA